MCTSIAYWHATLFCCVCHTRAASSLHADIFFSFLHCDLTPFLDLVFFFFFFFTSGLDFWEVWNMLMQEFVQCDKTAAENSCQISFVIFRMEVFCQSETFQACARASLCTVSLLLRSLFTLIALQLIKASLRIWGGSPLPRHSEALSYVPDITCHSSFCSVSVNRAQPLPLTFSNHVWSHLSPEAVSVTVTV